MIVCFDCPSNIKRVLDLLLANGEYRDYSEAIISAIQNLLIIQEEVKRKGVAFLGNNNATDEIDSVEQQAGLESLQDSRPIIKQERGGYKFNDFMMKQKSGIPNIFTLENFGRDLSEIPDDRIASPDEFKEYPVNHWIFGMYNRLLPAKANCRALAKTITERGGHGIPVEEQLEKVAYNIAEEAASLGDYLRKHDNNFNLKRDDGLSTAFPGSDPKDEKSRLRYASQFVARVDSKKNISGLLMDLRLIENVRGGNQGILLTKQGWKFALQENPILENLQNEPRDKFFDEEIDFLIDHICTRVPAEASAYYSIMNLLSSQTMAPNEMDEALTNLYKGEEDIGDEKRLARIATQRAGATSRMIDLKIIMRERTGTKLNYSITDRGQSLFTRLSQKIVQTQEGI